MGKRITSVLQDHDAVLAWLARRTADSVGDERHFMQREFVQCLGTHLIAVERVIKPVLDHCGVSDELAGWYAATEALKASLADALLAENDEARFNAAIPALIEKLHALREQEGEHLAATLTRSLTEGELRLLGGDIGMLLIHRTHPGTVAACALPPQPTHAPPDAA